MKLNLTHLLAAAFFALVTLPVPGIAADPEPVDREDFTALIENSPFLRPLDLSQTIVITGIVEGENQLMATLRNRETNESHLASLEPDSGEWRILELEGDRSNPESLTARIAGPAGQVFSARFDAKQFAPPPPSWRYTSKLSQEQKERVVEQARDYRSGISGDGYRGPPPPELVEKLSRLSQSQRERIIARIAELRNQGASSESRREAIASMADRALGERR